MDDDTPCLNNIYCDESRHTSDATDTYMVIGGIMVPRDHKREVVNKIHRLKKQHTAQGEFGWKRLSPNKRDFYWSLIDLFKNDDLLKFRCVVVNRNNLNHELYNQGDQELGFYKIYYQLLVHWLNVGCTHHIYLDWQQNKEQHRFSDLKIILQRKLSGRAKVACLEPVTSANQPLIELTDLFIGAVGYAWNQRSTSETKVQFCNELAESVGLGTLNTSTAKDFEKFNVFNFLGR